MDRTPNLHGVGVASVETNRHLIATVTNADGRELLLVGRHYCQWAGTTAVSRHYCRWAGTTAVGRDYCRWTGTTAVGQGLLPLGRDCCHWAGLDQSDFFASASRTEGRTDEESQLLVQIPLSMWAPQPTHLRSARSMATARARSLDMFFFARTSCTSLLKTDGVRSRPPSRSRSRSRPRSRSRSRSRRSRPRRSSWRSRARPWSRRRSRPCTIRSRKARSFSSRKTNPELVMPRRRLRLFSLLASSEKRLRPWRDPPAAHRRWRRTSR